MLLRGETRERASGKYHHARDFRCQHQRAKTNHHNGDMKTLAERLVSARSEKGLTQDQLAKAAGIKNQSTIGMLESGERRRSSYLAEIAEVLGVRAFWLATGRGPKYSATIGQPLLRDAHLLTEPHREVVQNLIDNLIRAQAATDGPLSLEPAAARSHKPM